MTPQDAGTEHPAAPAGHAVPARAAARYREEQVNNLGQQELLLMLYDGAIRFCGEARAAIDAGDTDTSYHRLLRARDIVTELLAILHPDVQFEAITNLRRLYDFCIYGITEVNFTKDLCLLDGVVRVLENLRATWAEIDFAGALHELSEATGLPEPEPTELLPAPATADPMPDATADLTPDAAAVAAAPGLSLMG